MYMTLSKKKEEDLLAKMYYCLAVKMSPFDNSMICLLRTCSLFLFTLAHSAHDRIYELRVGNF